jgi:hypothetical protein
VKELVYDLDKQEIGTYDANVESLAVVVNSCIAIVRQLALFYSVMPNNPYTTDIMHYILRAFGPMHPDPPMDKALAARSTTLRLYRRLSRSVSAYSTPGERHSAAHSTDSACDIDPMQVIRAPAAAQVEGGKGAVGAQQKTLSQDLRHDPDQAPWKEPQHWDQAGEVQSTDSEFSEQETGQDRHGGGLHLPQVPTVERMEDGLDGVAEVTTGSAEHSKRNDSVRDDADAGAGAGAAA